MSPRVPVIRGVWSGGSSFVLAATRGGKSAGLIVEREAALSDGRRCDGDRGDPANDDQRHRRTEAIEAFSLNVVGPSMFRRNTGRTNRAALVPGRASPH